MLVKFDLKKCLSKSATIKQLIDNLLLNPGLSYLINYTDLKANYRFYSKTDVTNYIVLASYRDYNWSLQNNDYTLDWDMCPLSIKELDNNKLLWHSNRRIFFMFEEKKASTLRKRNKNGY